MINRFIAVRLISTDCQQKISEESLR